MWFLLAVASLPEESPLFIYELREFILKACVVTERSRDEQRICALRAGNQSAVAALAKEAIFIGSGNPGRSPGLALRDPQ